MRGRTLAMVVLVAANFMDLMDTTVVNVALPSIQSDLGATGSQLEWMVGAYALGLAASLVTGGRLGDIIGVQRVFLAGIIGFTLSSLGAAVAGSADWLVAARATQGVCAGFMVPQVLAGVQALYPPDRRAPVYGLIGFITGSAAVIGPILSGALISSGGFGMGWRAIFVVNVPIGVALTAIALKVVPNARSTRPPRLDLPGVALLTAAIVCLALPLIDGRQAGWPWWSWTLLGTAPILLAGFVSWQFAVERSGTTPLIPVHLFRNRAYAAGSVVNFSFQAGLVGVFLVLTLYVQQALGYSALQSGLVWLGFSLGTLVGSVLAAMVASRIGPPLMTFGAILAAASVTVVAQWHPAATPPPHWWQVSAVLTIGGIGMGLLVVPLFDAALASVPAADAGSASGALSTVQQIGGTLGVAVIGGIFYDYAGAQPTGTSLATALQVACWCSVAAFGVAAAAGTAFGRAPVRTESQKPSPTPIGCPQQLGDA
ncbi:DHA2 family efflux MFS transporter permease subunit [Kribbella sp. NPDC050241]|uniref:DHA2 family efflux MFS transporter permease subunit n=1 Tax=Kribbella sp. NPDC050241 TaxID=3364115 RepID=UPI003789A858